MLINRRENIKQKGFTLELEKDTKSLPDFSKQNNVKVGIKTLEDATLDLGYLTKKKPITLDKESIIAAISRNDINKLRAVSTYFRKVSGMYSRLVQYFARIYKYDLFTTVYVEKEDGKKEKILERFNKVLKVLDGFNAKKRFGEIALSVIEKGCYYGYAIDLGDDTIVLQDLPIEYCRTRFKYVNKSAVEFNMKFFDDQFKDVGQRLKMLNLFPSEFKKGYLLFKEGKLPPCFQGDSPGWYLLDPTCTAHFTINNSEIPYLISTIPAIMDLDEAKELDKKKMMQQLLKIVVQKLPLDKDGELIFDPDEAAELHNNVVRMLTKAIGVDVLTTFADTSVEDMADRNTTTTTDDLQKVERSVYNEAGSAQNLFNTDGNLALEKSIANDEAAISDLIYQFEEFLNDIVSRYNDKKVRFKTNILPTTIFNFQALAKSYKELTQLGYSKMLPQIALGQSQSSIIATAYFENKILNLTELFVPPMSSNTMSGNAIKAAGSNKVDKKEVGREEKPDDQKSEKTIQNRESMS